MKPHHKKRKGLLKWILTTPGLVAGIMLSLSDIYFIPRAEGPWDEIKNLGDNNFYCVTQPQSKTNVYYLWISLDFVGGTLTKHCPVGKLSVLGKI